MKIEIDTSKELSELDLRMLRELDTLNRERERALRQRIDALETELSEAQQSARELERTTPAKDLKERVESIFESPDAIYTVAEVMRMVDHDHYGSVYGCLHILREEGRLDSSSTRPVKFFNKKAGNPELRAAIPPGTTVSVMR